MKTLLNTSDYSRVESIICGGFILDSTYCHNYYYNKSNEDIILEESNDDQTCYYYRIEQHSCAYVKTYIGLTEDNYGYGIFDEDYEGYPYRNDNGEIELDDTLC